MKSLTKRQNKQTCGLRRPLLTCRASLTKQHPISARNRPRVDLTTPLCVDEPLQQYPETTSAHSSMAASHAVRIVAAAIALTSANAAVYDVSPDGQPMSLTAALGKAGAGDTIKLADGTYREPIVTQQGGEDGKPLTIEGGRGAVINYFSGDQSMMWSQNVVDIKHSWVTLRVRV